MKNFQEPIIEIINLESEDIVTASGMCTGDTPVEGGCVIGG